MYSVASVSAILSALNRNNHIKLNNLHLRATCTPTIFSIPYYTYFIPISWVAKYDKTNYATSLDNICVLQNKGSTQVTLFCQKIDSKGL